MSPTVQKIAYIVTTVLFVLAIAPSSILDIVQPEIVVTTMEGIDLPLYVLTLIGFWKILGIIALALPRFRRVNEWAYAGFFFDLTGAAWVHFAGGDTAVSIITPLVFLVLLAPSYLLRPRRQDAPEAAAPSPAAVTVTA